MKLRPWMIVPLFLFAACNSSKKVSRDFTYFQRGLDSLGTVSYKEALIQSNDLLSVQVYSGTLSQEQATLFNLPNTEGYLVDINGNISMPVVGRIKASGLTRAQLAQRIEDQLTPYIKGPSVLVRYRQFKVNILGEVRSPGTQNFTTDRVTLIDALGAAGDLTDFGKRENIKVFREESGERKMYEVDLRSAALFQSPAFQLQQNDIVYVSANKNKLGQVDVNPRTQRDLSLGLSVLSGLAFLLNTYLVLSTR
ncbi:MAG: polysaccharide biosynthesis/export family protein [Chitinophagaceae bacterium]